MLRSHPAHSLNPLWAPLAPRPLLKPVVCFAQVYVSEAHPVDEWKVYSDIDYCQPRTLEERWVMS